MTRAVMYLRISLDRTGEQLAVERQRDECMRFIEFKRWNLTGEYVDNSISATKRKPRPAYVKMWKDIDAGEIDVVVVYRVDRLTRQPLEILEWAKLQDERGVNLVTSDGSLDLSSASGKTFAGLMAVMAEGEMRTKGDRQKAAHVQRAALGKPWATRRPFGFKANAIDHEPEEAAAIRGLYDRLIEGESQSSLARMLNEAGFTTTMGGPFRQSTVRVMMMNPRNAGLRAHNGVIVGDGAWEPIVPEALWRTAVALMSTGQQKGGGAAKHLLPGVAVCQVCSAPARTAYSNRGVRMYTCGAAQHVGRNAEALEAYVERVAVARLTAPDAFVHTQVDADDPMEGLAQKAQQLRDRMASFGVAAATGDMLPDQVAVANQHVLAQLAVIENTLAMDDGRRVLAPLLAARNVQEAWDGMTVANKRRVLKALMVVRIGKTARGSRFNPEDIEIDWVRS